MSLLHTFVAAATAVTAIGASTGGIAGARLYVRQDSPAQRQAKAWRAERPQDAALMELIASQPTASWMNGWTSDVRGEVAKVVTAAERQRTTPVLVAYNIPFRDCGSYSAGGVEDGNRYAKWIRQFADGLSGRKAVVVLEPDAIAGASCLKGNGQSERFAMLADAVDVLKKAGAAVYLDAGHARWMKADVMAARLHAAGIDKADGFALNVSNFISTKENMAFGDDLSRRVGGKHYIIDTSRNGVSSASSEWCNPSGKGLGAAPTTNTGHPLVDAFLWIKVPGESDGSCNGGPASGKWWPEYALGLARAAGGVAAN